MKKEKNKIKFPSKLLIASMIGIIVSVVGGMIAYAAITAREEKTNNLRIGDFQTKVQEEFTAPTEMSLGTEVKKEVAIENTGEVDQFVRVLVHPEIWKEVTGSPNQILPTKLGEQIILGGGNATDWKDGGDGFYYYLKVLKPGEKTTFLFTSVKLAGTLDAVYDGSKFKMTIKAESINCVKGAYLDAWFGGTEPASGDKKVISDALKALAAK